MKIDRFVIGPVGTNCYIVRNEALKECFVIDPEGDFHDLMWALDSDDIFEAIWEIIDGMEETINDITKPDWRAKS